MKCLRAANVFFGHTLNLKYAHADSESTRRFLSRVNLLSWVMMVAFASLTLFACEESELHMPPRLLVAQQVHGAEGAEQNVSSKTQVGRGNHPS